MSGREAHDGAAPASASDGAARARGIRVSRAALAVAVLFALLYAYDLFEAVSNAFGVTAQIADYNRLAVEAGLAEATVPWTLVVANILVAPVVFGAALLLARRRGIGILALLLAAGLCVVAAVSLSLVAFA